MRQRLRAVRGRENGFTLTELLIVIVILGVLTGIVVFAVGAFSDRGEKAACKADIKTASVAVEAFRAHSNTNALPGTLAELVPNYLREVPPTAADGINDGTEKYTIKYFPTAVTGPPAIAAGTVTGTLTGGGAC